jgi:hypothetical protein
MINNVNKQEDIVAIAFESLLEALKQSAEVIVDMGDNSCVNRITNAPDCEVYGEMLTSLADMKQSLFSKSKNMFGKFNSKKIAAATEVHIAEEMLLSATDKVLATTTDKVSAKAKVKAFAALMFKKVVALRKGVLSFSFDTTTILGTAIGRITYNTAREFILGDMSKSTNISDNGIWNLISCEIELDNSPYDGPQLIGDNFYIGAPVCPHCNEFMFKTVFPVGGEYKIDTSKGFVQMKRVFTCVLCKVFFTPIPGNRVSDGMVFERKFLSKGDYVDALEHMDKYGSLKGRMDL